MPESVCSSAALAVLMFTRPVAPLTPDACGSPAINTGFRNGRLLLPYRWNMDFLSISDLGCPIKALSTSASGVSPPAASIAWATRAPSLQAIDARRHNGAINIDIDLSWPQLTSCRIDSKDRHHRKRIRRTRVHPRQPTSASRSNDTPHRVRRPNVAIANPLAIAMTTSIATTTALWLEQLFRPAIHPFDPFVLFALRHSKHLPTLSCQARGVAAPARSHIGRSRSNQNPTKTLRKSVHLFRHASPNEQFRSKRPDSKRPTMQKHRRPMQQITRDLGKSHAERAPNVCVLRSWGPYTCCCQNQYTRSV